MTLLQAPEGEPLVVTGTIGEELSLQALRFGINAGSEIRVQKKIPGGPVIISKNQLEIAIGPQLAIAIKVERRPTGA